MRQRRAMIGLLVFAALTLGLVPGGSSAGPESAWACAAANPVASECTVTGPAGATAGGALYNGRVRVFVNNVKVFENLNPGCFHLSTLQVANPLNCPAANDIGGAGKVVKGVALDAGGFIIVGSRGA